MLKNLIYCSAIVLLATSCSEDFDDWASPQGYAGSEESLSVQFAATSAADIDMATASDVVPFFTYTLNMPEGYLYDSLALNVVDKTAGAVYPLACTAENGNVSVAKSDLAPIVESIYGKRPTARTITFATTAFVYTSSSRTMVVRSAADTLTINVTPEAPFISSGYYLVGDMVGWDYDGAVAHPFSHSGEDVYEDPVFSIVFTTTADNQYWKIIPQENVDAGNIWADGVVGTITDGETALSGGLVNVNAQAGKIEKAGKYRMTLNMMDYTYTIEEVRFDDFVYFIGATDGWSASDQKLALASEDGMYKGFVYCADPNGWGNEFKFQRVAGSWDNEINSGTFASISGDFADGGSNIKAMAGEGVYYVELDLGHSTLHAVKVEKMGIIGDFNGWSGDVEMTWNATDYCYEATAAGATANGWKFRVNADWTINLGGSMDALDYGGDNIAVDANTIKLYPTRKTSDNIYCTAN